GKADGQFSADSPSHGACSFPAGKMAGGPSPVGIRRLPKMFRVTGRKTLRERPAACSERRRPCRKVPGPAACGLRRRGFRLVLKGNAPLGQRREERLE